MIFMAMIAIEIKNKEKFLAELKQFLGGFSEKEFFYLKEVKRLPNLEEMKNYDPEEGL